MERAPVSTKISPNGGVLEVTVFEVFLLLCKLSTAKSQVTNLWFHMVALKCKSHQQITQYKKILKITTMHKKAREIMKKHYILEPKTKFQKTEMQFQKIQKVISRKNVKKQIAIRKQKR